MKTIKKVIFAILMVMVAVSVQAADDVISISLEKKPKQDPGRGIPKGPRMPSMKAECIISIPEQQITTDIPSEILSYELWDTDGETIEVAFSDEESMTQYLSSIVGEYQLHLVTEEYIYIGFLYLDD